MILRKKIPLLILVLSFIFSSCGVEKQIANLSKLQFELQNLQSISLANIRIDNKKKYSDFNSLEILRISASFIQGKLPLKFLLNVQMKNPNYNILESNSDIIITSFPWRLFLDGKETASGNIKEPITIRGNKKTTTIPINIQLNLIDFFKNQGYKNLVNLALNISQQKTSPTKFELFVKPVVSTQFGNINYPSEIRIISYSFSN